MNRNIGQLNTPDSNLNTSHKRAVRAVLDEIEKRGLAGNEVGPKLACEMASEFIDSNDPEMAIDIGMIVIGILRERRRNESEAYRLDTVKLESLVDQVRIKFYGSIFESDK